MSSIPRYLYTQYPRSYWAASSGFAAGWAPGNGHACSRGFAAHRCASCQTRPRTWRAQRRSSQQAGMPNCGSMEYACLCLQWEKRRGFRSVRWGSFSFSYSSRSRRVGPNSALTQVRGCRMARRRSAACSSYRCRCCSGRKSAPSRSVGRCGGVTRLRGRARPGRGGRGRRDRRPRR